jgi:phosphopantothenoylcysteine decarboxylase
MAQESSTENQASSSVPSNSESQSEIPFCAADHASDNKMHLLLATSGSVATIKIGPILQALSKHSSLSIRLIVTESSSRFLAGQSCEQPRLSSLAVIPNVDGLYQDEDEWAHSWTRSAPILHLELRRWADLMVIAPLSANTMAKIVNGLADNLLTCVVRAWDVDGEVDGDGRAGRKSIIVAPAMNTAMWRQPVTARQIKTLEEWDWFEVLQPIGKMLACGDVGLGAMMQWEDIVKIVEKRLGLLGEGSG